MGTYRLGAEDIKESFKQWLQERSMQEGGDITAETMAEAWNEISREEAWGDKLEASYNE